MAEWKVILIALFVVCYFIYKYVFEQLDLIMKFNSKIEDEEFPGQFDYQDNNFLRVNQNFEIGMLASFIFTGLLALTFFIIIFSR